MIRLCCQSIQAQQSKPDPCDSIKSMYDQALVFLDSSLGNQNQLQKQLDKTRAETARLKAEINKLVKDKTETSAELKEATKLISEQMQRIEKLEAEVKRLSTPAKSSKQN